MKKTIRTMTTIGMLLAVGSAFITPLHAEPQKTSEQPSEKSSEAVSIRVMTYNIYRGGTKRGQALSQTAKVIQEAKADISACRRPAIMRKSWPSYWVGITTAPS